MTWNEFQKANKGKYSKSEMSDAWNKYKQANYSNGGQHYLHRPYLRESTINGITRGRGANGTYFDANTLEPIIGTPLILDIDMDMNFGESEILLKAKAGHKVNLMII